MRPPSNFRPIYPLRHLKGISEAACPKPKSWLPHPWQSGPLASTPSPNITPFSQSFKPYCRWLCLRCVSGPLATSTPPTSLAGMTVMASSLVSFLPFLARSLIALSVRIIVSASEAAHIIPLRKAPRWPLLLLGGKVRSLQWPTRPYVIFTVPDLVSHVLPDRARSGQTCLCRCSCPGNVGLVPPTASVVK